MSNDIVVDLNRISKRDFRAWFQGRDGATDKDIWDAEHLYTKVIVSWPYDQEISVEGYENLGVLDSLTVDNTVSNALVEMGKKKSELRLT